MRVLVCGGRKYAQRGKVHLALDRLHAEYKLEGGICILIHGNASGADTLAKEWAEERGIAVDPYHILPGEGGYGRNRRMLEQSGPDLVVHFPGGNGTKHMRNIANAAGVQTIGGLAL